MTCDILEAPSALRIKNCELSGWEYLGDGIFVKGNDVGYFTPDGWINDDWPPA